MTPFIKRLACPLLTACLTACSSSGDTRALLVESAEACSLACASHPGVTSFAYEAGGGSPLLFSGKIAATCGCSDATR